MSSIKMQRRVRTSGVLVSFGLIVELASLLWSRPTAFIFFLVPGVLLMTMGIVFYLYSLLSVPEPSKEPSDVDNVSLS